MDFRTKFQRGFTLVEMAIVILIIGLLLAFLGQIYKIYVHEKQEAELKETLDTVRTALAEFIVDDPGVADPVRYPCPASPTAPPGDAIFGLEQFDSVTGQCSATNGVVQSVDALTGKTVFIGSVPTNTLDIAAKYMLDPYDNRLTYAVTGALAANDGMLNPASDAAAIKVETSAGGANPLATETIDTEFALVTHGRTGVGAFTLQGIQTAPCVGATGDQENCNGDDTFAIDIAQTNAVGANFFDDAGAFALADDGDGWWTATDGSGTDIYNINGGNVGVGTTDPESKFHIANNYEGNPAEVKIIPGDYGIFEVGHGPGDDGDTPFYSLSRKDQQVAWQLGLLGDRFTIAVGDNADLANPPRTDLFDSKVFVIDGSGDIGIGTDAASAPEARLHVRETDGNSLAFMVENNYEGDPAEIRAIPGDYGIFEVVSGAAGNEDDGDTPYYSLNRADREIAWQLGLLGDNFVIAHGDGADLNSTPRTDLFASDSNSRTMVMDPEGDVGIGVIDPLRQLHISPGEIRLQHNAVNYWDVAPDGGNNFQITQNGAPRITIDGTAPNQGYVGIGTTDPRAPLDVVGEIKMSTSSPELACTADTRGSMRYDPVSDQMQYCALNRNENTGIPSPRWLGFGVTCTIATKEENTFTILSGATRGAQNFQASQSDWGVACGAGYHVTGCSMTSPEGGEQDLRMNNNGCFSDDEEWGETIYAVCCRSATDMLAGVSAGSGGDGGGAGGRITLDQLPTGASAGYWGITQFIAYNGSDESTQAQDTLNSYTSDLALGRIPEGLRQLYSPHFVTSGPVNGRSEIYATHNTGNPVYHIGYVTEPAYLSEITEGNLGNAAYPYYELACRDGFEMVVNGFNTGPGQNPGFNSGSSSVRMWGTCIRR